MLTKDEGSLSWEAPGVSQVGWALSQAPGVGTMGM